MRRVQMSGQPLLSTREVAHYLGIPETTLHRWAHKGTGPGWFKIGKHRRYDPEAVHEWLRSQAHEAMAEGKGTAERSYA
jgi:excisionase family DNA binding protein